MQVTWNYSKSTEAIRVLAASHHVRTRFYQKKHFCVLPYMVEKNSRVICLPDLQFNSIPDYWERVKERSCVTDIHNADLVQSVENLLPPLDLSYGKLKKDWERVETQLFNALESITPGIFSDIVELEIRPSKYGSVASSLSAWLPTTSRLIVYIRSDCDISHIVEAFFIDQLLKMEETKLFSWEENEAITDFLLLATPLKKLLPEYKPTLSFIRSSQHGALIEASNEYLRKLGFGAEQLFHAEDGRISLLQEEFVLGQSEKKIMTCLIAKRGSVVSYDELADTLWQQEADDKYSLYAISKSVERLRSKVEAAGIFPDIIQTVRGTGYILND